ncbi:uncharacterized protein MELLADRAFT_114192 [Melampsora larici-populina 98AG31]|uniref:Secreted protein n=1 Tax=Melampsora larici-populina (strain 98AG31 / pathotype 3-4-7) TaxID=747676 RepID=F4SCJ7_MELLP|nr:uncharacterized protein MELLADRAFT_114192 [Melampsora larici-populina 98AG31]EGF97629.1 secreted protein [Melampsora larici-populina 98AG31]
MNQFRLLIVIAQFFFVFIPTNGMTCDGNADRVGDPADCFNALEYIYAALPNSGCAVAGSCAMMPLTGSYHNLISPEAAPPYTLEEVEASYDGLFGHYCEGYVSPITAAADWPKDAFNSGFLLGTTGGPDPTECPEAIAQQIVEESKAYSGP